MDFRRAAKILIIFVIVLAATIITIHLLSRSNNVDDAENKNATMKMLFPIFRHGARQPLVKIPNNPNNDLWLTMGDADLTDIGKEQQILSGQLTRQNYASFLSKSLNDSELFIQSSALSRTILSAKYFVVGLFNLSENEIWNTKDLYNNFWPSIKVHTIYSKEYYEKLMKFCVDTLKQFPDSTFNQHTIEAIVNHTGLDNTNYDMETVFLYADSLTTDASMNMSAPFGLEEYMDDVIKFRHQMYDVALLKISKEIAFAILNDVVERIEAFQSGNSSMKTHVICLHDVHIAAIITALTNTTIGSPPFSSLIYFELFTVNNNVHMDHIILKYRASVTSNVVSFPILNCGLPCPYHTFKNIVARMNSSNAIM